MAEINHIQKRFVALKGQPIHKGHCYLIDRMLHDSFEEEIIIIGIVNPYPHENMDMSRNRKPDNFLIERNPLTYFERAYLLRIFLTSIQDRYSNINSSSIVITPYFIPTVFEKEKMYNYLPMKEKTVEYISDKDAFEVGKKEELEKIGVNVKFVKGLKNNRGEYYSADFLRNQIFDGVIDKHSYDKIIYDCMEQMNLFSIIKERITNYKD